MNATHAPLERLHSLRELEKAGYGGRATLTKMILSGEIPGVRTRSGYKIRESHVHLIAVPVEPVRGEAS